MKKQCVLFAVIACVCAASAVRAQVPYQSPGNFYTQGALAVDTQTVVVTVREGFFKLNLAVDIYYPTDAAYVYPVVHFSHGFTLKKEEYQDVLLHLASHGFVVVATQSISTKVGHALLSPEAETQRIVQVVQWLAANLADTVPVGVNMALFGLAGHSRGGQIAYRLADDPALAAGVQALAVVDPVDAIEDLGQTPHISGPLALSMPTCVLGTGLGWKRNLGMLGFMGELSYCAPPEKGHTRFYTASPSPSWHVLVTDYGHFDMLDEADLSSLDDITCRSNPGNRDAMRAMVGGTLAAFFSGTLQGAPGALGVLDDAAGAPVTCFMGRKTTPTTMVGFEADTSDPLQVRLAWQTRNETDAAGFVLYRSENPAGPFAPVAASLTAPCGTDNCSYSYVDTGVSLDTTYWYVLEDNDTAGNSSRHGPIFAYPHSFVDNGDNTVTDLDTGLMWQQDARVYENGDRDNMTWQEAIQYCENLVFAGYDDWRLPSVNELQSLADYRRYSPASVPEVLPFPLMRVTYGYWSSTTVEEAPDKAWLVVYGSGKNGMADKGLRNTFVRPVRGPNATLITLSSLIAEPGSGRVSVRWTTGSEIDNAGFNIYRSESPDGAYRKINAVLLPARGSATGGFSYTFEDLSVRNRQRYYYKLEDIDLSGTHTLHGPVSALPRLRPLR